MKTLLKAIVVFVSLFLVLGIGAFAWVQATYERDFSATPLPKLVASRDPVVIAQGDYLVHAVAHCSACHQPAHSMAKFELNPNRVDLRGGFEFNAGPFGTYYAANLTGDVDTGLGSVSDGLVARAIRHGVDRHGRFAAFMALSVGAMADQDLVAVLSYLRTLPGQRNPVPRDTWGLVAKALARKFAPHAEAAPQYVAAGAVSVERGRYLANGPAGCYSCHSQRDPMNGFAIMGPRFAGNPDAEPDDSNAAFELAAPNLTPHSETGRISGWSEERFVARFRAGRYLRGSRMPWDNFAQMTEQDLRSIYQYLHRLTPVQRDVGPSRRKAGWKPES